MKSLSLLPCLALVLSGITKGTMRVCLKRLLEPQMANAGKRCSPPPTAHRTRPASRLVERELHYLSWPLSGAFGPRTWLQSYFSEQQQENILNLLKNNKYILLWVKFNDRLNALSTMMFFSFSCPGPLAYLTTCDSQRPLLTSH